ncbi:hypothetical protein KC19_3G162300 [Ceratodon purpureus]|uniref:Uncharacterized protein n=1 Tax=Ceratodon purpureus TaxID=3225 RepID=A0A8T0IIZ8_CERPU|nr:hypothetical protein KC19_3G162300 [Ceratodon purpureus]
MLNPAGDQIWSLHHYSATLSGTCLEFLHASPLPKARFHILNFLRRWLASSLITELHVPAMGFLSIVTLDDNRVPIPKPKTSHHDDAITRYRREAAV